MATFLPCPEVGTIVVPNQKGKPIAVLDTGIGFMTKIILAAHFPDRWELFWEAATSLEPGQKTRGLVCFLTRPPEPNELIWIRFVGPEGNFALGELI
jgi:hypothetical protein